MNAQEAKKQAENAGNKWNTFDCLIEIKKAVKDGKFDVWMYEKEISYQARKELTEKGYNVGKTQFDRNDILTHIEW